MTSMPFLSMMEFQDRFLVAASLTIVTLAWAMVQMLRAVLVKESSYGSVSKAQVLPDIDKHGALTAVGQKGICAVLAKPCSPLGHTFGNNDPAPTFFDCGDASGSVLILHKPTCDMSSNQSGNYQYSEHMHTRKRLWEFRWQLSFKTEVQGDVFIGLEQDEYKRVSWVQRCAASGVLAALRGASGGAMHHSYGDDPAENEGELERPAVMFLLSLADQLIVTPEGEQPPSLSDPSFPDFGLTKANNRKAFCAAFANLELVPGHTYSFGFWSVSQFCDAIGWNAPARGFMPRVKFEDIGIHAPCFFVMYSLKPHGENDKQDVRHLDSRKSYFLRIAYWSTLAPPDPSRAKMLLQGETLQIEQLAKASRGSGCWFC